MNKYKLFKNRIFLFTFMFLVIFFIGYFPIIRGHSTLIWQIDGLGQYYPAFNYIGRYLQNFLFGIFHGQWILPSFDLSIGMGEDIIGTLNYYGFGDPLNLLAIFVTKNNSAYLFSFMILLRMWLSGISLIYYFNYLKFSSFSSALAALCYTFCGFAIYGGTMYVEWLSVLIYTPLILLGIEKIMNKEKYTFFVLAICYAGLCGFYFLFMSSLILAFYLPIRLLFRLSNFKNIFLTILKTFFAYLLGILLSAPFFLPSISAYMTSERQSTDITQIIFNKSNYLPKLNFDFFSYLSQPFFVDSPYLSGIIILEFLSIIGLFFLPNTKKKFQCVLFLIIALVAASLPITSYIFNAFGQTNDRWIYILHLLFAGIFVFVLDTCLLYTSKSSNKLNLNKNQLQLIHILLMVSVTLNISINVHSLYSEKNQNWQSEFIKYSHINIYTESPYSLFINSTDQKDLYRVSTDSLTGINGRPENVAMLNNYNGLTYWFSIINKNTQRVVDNFNHNSLKWRSFGFGANSAFNTIYGVKYYLTKNNLNDSNNYKRLDTVMFNNEPWNIYENVHFSNFSYLIDSKQLLSIFSSTDSYDNKMNALYSIIDSTSIDSKYEMNQITLSSKDSEKKSLILPIPYNKNWSVYVDGKKQLLNKIDSSFMSIDLSAGTHQVNFVYKNNLILLGIICSIFSLISLFCLNKTRNITMVKNNKLS